MAAIESLFIALTLLFLGMISARAETHLKINWDEVHVGTAENKSGPTGATVMHFSNKSVLAAVDIGGGAAAVAESSAVDPLNTWGSIDALFIAGGSSYGLAARDGVMAELLKLRKNSVAFDLIPAVPGAIVYDFSGRKNSIYPDGDLGAKAFRAAKSGLIPMGRVGAGVNVTAGKVFGRKYMEQSGQGAAYMEFEGGVKVLAITVVNAMGAIHDRSGSVVLGNRDPETGARNGIVERLLKDNGAKSVEPVKGNTTISILVTNLKLDRLELARLARSTHTAMGRVIEPFQTQDDGDTLFAVSTRSLELTGDKKPEMSVLASIAGRTMQDAVLSIPSSIQMKTKGGK